jgi:hypothetical protein
MVVHLGEAQVLVRKVPQLVDGDVNLDATIGDGGQQVAYTLLFDV